MGADRGGGLGQLDSRNALVQLSPMRWLSGLLVIALAWAGIASAKPKSSEDAQFRAWLIHYLKNDPDNADDDDLQNLVYGYALFDLNGDGRNEAIVWARDSSWCGTSGCALSIFSRTKSGWKFASDGPNTRPPIQVLASRTHGWRDLSGFQYGGGVDRPFRSWIRFDGHDYGWSKTGWKVPRHVSSRVIIKDATIPLFPSKCRRTEEAPSVFGPMPMKSAKAGSC
jgi:hypothetical protein